MGDYMREVKEFTKSIPTLPICPFIFGENTHCKSVHIYCETGLCTDEKRYTTCAIYKWMVTRGEKDVPASPIDYQVFCRPSYGGVCSLA